MIDLIKNLLHFVLYTFLMIENIIRKKLPLLSQRDIFLKVLLGFIPTIRRTQSSLLRHLLIL